MKSIVYLLITLIVSSLVVSTVPMSNKKNEKSITLQCTDTHADLEMLTKSAMIFENRLKDFSPEKFEIILSPEKMQIQVLLSDSWDINLAINLLTPKGSVKFYETYNQDSLSALLNGDDHLFSLLNDVVADRSGAKIGCVSGSELEKVSDYLQAVGLSQKCRFVWSLPSDNSDACLYALKLNADQGALLTNTDLEGVTYSQYDTASSSIEFKFKPKAAKLWANVTRKNIGHAIAITLDDYVIHAPILKAHIENGKCSITGNFSETEARFFATLVNHRELALNFEIVK